MSSEIVVADPGYDYEGDPGTVTEYTTPTTVTRSITSGSEHDIDHQYVPEPFESERLPPTLESGIQRFLRVANLIEREEPRIAYLCKFKNCVSFWAIGFVLYVDFIVLITSSLLDIIGFECERRYRMF